MPKGSRPIRLTYLRHQRLTLREPFFMNRGTLPAVHEIDAEVVTYLERP
ncbi:hypothetical protein PAP18089_03699 [Pandoraea apista]|uniref:Uncharacterized protein n=1 Tax=Pandoraea apista TaxID=93218 RepID=A0A5E5PAJ9_9BURK|nr:hypothetical protein LMG16407_01636 [Pandoraea apista]VVG72699.1 hypothetical protein PAP18089_03699 [Pandoraea apista]